MPVREMCRFCGQVFAIGFVAALCCLTGCNQQPAAAPAAKASPPASVKKAAAAVDSSKKSSVPRVTEKDGKKYLDDIPYDVFFDDPLAIASDSTNVGAPSTPVAATTDTPQTADTPMPEKTTPAATSAGSGNWADYIAMEQLQEESKRIRNQLKSLLQTPATYKEDFEVIKMDGAVLSALAVMTAESGEGISWKPNAGYIRDYGFEMFEAAKGPAKPNYDATNAVYENLQAVFDGTVPPGAAEPALIVRRPMWPVDSI